MTSKKSNTTFFKKYNPSFIEIQTSNVVWKVFTLDQKRFLVTLPIAPKKMLEVANEWRFTTHKNSNTFQIRFLYNYATFKQVMFVLKFWFHESEMTPIVPCDQYCSGIYDVAIIKKFMETFYITPDQLNGPKEEITIEKIDDELNKLEQKRRFIKET